MSSAQFLLTVHVIDLKCEEVGITNLRPLCYAVSKFPSERQLFCGKPFYHLCYNILILIYYCFSIMFLFSFDISRRWRTLCTWGLLSGSVKYQYHNVTWLPTFQNSTLSLIQELLSANIWTFLQEDQIWTVTV